VTFARAVSGFLLLLSLPSGIVAAQQTTQPEKPKLAGGVFKNVQVLQDLPEQQFWETMSFFTDSLGVNCERCHETPFEADKKPEKIKARQMIRMVRDLNTHYFDGTRKVTCNTCHRGTTTPLAEPSLDAQRWMNFGRVEGPLPDGAALIASYQRLTGVSASAVPHAERVSYEMTIYLSEGLPKRENTELTIAAPERFRVSTRNDAGTREWIRDGAAGWFHDANGWQPVDGRKMFDVSSEASSFKWENLKDVTDSKSIKMDMARGRQAIVVEARDHGERVWLYFDNKTGLLLRRRAFSPSYFADSCWDIEYDDYRRVGPVVLPYLVQILNPAGNGLTIRKVKERVLARNFDARLFAKPDGAVQNSIRCSSEHRRRDGSTEEVLPLPTASFHRQPAGTGDWDGGVRRRSLPWSGLA
jgi:photosynthetic reaction center cytochrome c subunit